MYCYNRDRIRTKLKGLSSV
ncbi:hypothetical protein [Castellaniella sp.]